MSRYKKGDVVLVYFPYQDENGDMQVKKRPAVVLENLDDDNILIQCTSKNRSDKLPGIWVLKDSKEGRKMGILSDSFINVTNQISLKTIHIVRLIGYCPFMEKIDELLGLD